MWIISISKLTVKRLKANRLRNKMDGFVVRDSQPVGCDTPNYGTFFASCASQKQCLIKINAMIGTTPLLPTTPAGCCRSNNVQWPNVKAWALWFMFNQDPCFMDNHLSLHAALASLNRSYFLSSDWTLDVSAHPTHPPDHAEKIEAG